MTALILAPFACSATVGAASFLGVRPIVAAAAMPFVVGGCWMFA